MILVARGTGFVGTKVVHATGRRSCPCAWWPWPKQDQLRAWGCEVVQGDMTADSLPGR